MMNAPISLSGVEQMIRDQVQESIHLDYKASKAVNRAARDEIAKDVSAFANSDGGVLIYGVEEDKTAHLPVRIDDGVDDSDCSREWIENTITSRINPKVDDVRILPLPVALGRSLYVISIAKSFRGPHQASDKKFYKRHNFKSEPMEEYEINDVRNRRQRVPPLITFQVGEYRRFIAAFDVSNNSDSVAEDVRFEFPEALPWTDRGMPHLFAKGITRFPPHQQFRFLYFSFADLLQGGRNVPDEFVVRVSYYHPQAARRVTDEWPVNFKAYENSTAVRPEMEEQAKDIVEWLKKLHDKVDALNKTIQKFVPIAGSTGLDLSIPSLRNLKRIVADGESPEPIHPQGCAPEVFREVLGVDIQMAVDIYSAISRHYDPDRLKAIPGMTDDLIEKIREAFVLPSKPLGESPAVESSASPDVPRNDDNEA